MGRVPHSECLAAHTPSFPTLYMPPKTTIWPRGPHTEGKHRVLRHYLDAWLPILGSWNGRILFVDGFAGPGEYGGGEDGSPIIAMKALIEHSSRNVIRSEVVFFFIESDRARADHLSRLVDALKPHLPPNAKATVICGEFDESMTEVLNRLDEQRKAMAPAFVMIDPFGVSGTPMRVIERIMKNQRCEVYISFMYENMNRFLESDEFQPHLDELFGTREWRDAASLQGEERRQRLYALYSACLKRAGARHVVHFDLYEGNRMVYGIFFGTQHATGCDRMKQAIWKVAPFGDFCFRGSRDNQLTLGVDQASFARLEEALCHEFGTRGWVTVDAVQDYVASDRVEYHTGQLKKQVLKPMEAAGRIEIDESSRKRRSTYPAGTRLRFRC